MKGVNKQKITRLTGMFTREREEEGKKYKIETGRFTKMKEMFESERNEEGKNTRMEKENLQV